MYLTDVKYTYDTCNKKSMNTVHLHIEKLYNLDTWNERPNSNATATVCGALHVFRKGSAMKGIENA